MNTITMQTLKRLEATKGPKHHTSSKKHLKVFYGWSKINKIQKREAIAIAFENSEGAGWKNSRSGKSLRKTMTICYEIYQTDEEMKDKQIAGLYPWEKTDLTESLFHFLNTKK